MKVSELTLVSFSGTNPRLDVRACCDFIPSPPTCSPLISLKISETLFFWYSGSSNILLVFFFLYRFIYYPLYIVRLSSLYSAFLPFPYFSLVSLQSILNLTPWASKNAAKIVWVVSTSMVYVSHSRNQGPIIFLFRGVFSLYSFLRFQCWLNFCPESNEAWKLYKLKHESRKVKLSQRSTQ